MPSSLPKMLAEDRSTLYSLCIFNGSLSMSFAASGQIEIFSVLGGGCTLQRVSNDHEHTHIPRIYFFVVTFNARRLQRQRS